MANPYSALRGGGIASIDESTRSIRVVASTRNPVRGFKVDEKGNATPRLEALDSWDLTRFSKNNIVFWMHDGMRGAIGTADEVQETERGLEMRITFAAPHDEPRGEEAWKRVKAKLLRGVSVGFDFGEERIETRNGQQVSVFSKNVLNEVSMAPLPADEDALIDTAPPTVLADDAERAKRPFAGYDDFDACVLDQKGKGEDDDSARRICGKLQSEAEEKRRKLSDAGRELASGRQKRADGTDGPDVEGELVQRFDTYGTMGRPERTQVGGIRVPARLSRTGVLVYRNRDGTTRRELRLPEEVFNADSLASLRSAPVTDLAHHNDFISTRNWKQATLGHVEAARADGNFLAGELVINDAQTVVDIENHRLRDISCGYVARLDASPGTWEGEPYDVVQRAIRYNHVAVLPPGRGRAGTDVGIRFDATDAESVEEQPEPEDTMKIIHLDGKDYEYGSEAHLAKIDAMHSAELVKAQEATAAAVKRADEAQARFDAAERSKKTADEDAAKKEEEAKKAERAKFRSRLRLHLRALRAMDEEDAEDMHSDAKDDALDTLLNMSDRELMLKVIRADDKDFVDTGKSDDYIAAFFDIACKKAKRADGIDGVVAAADKAKRLDATHGSAAVDKAESDARTRATEAWKKPLVVSKQ